MKRRCNRSCLLLTKFQIPTTNFVTKPFWRRTSVAQADRRTGVVFADAFPDSAEGSFGDPIFPGYPLIVTIVPDFSISLDNPATTTPPGDENSTSQTSRMS